MKFWLVENAIEQKKVSTYVNFEYKIINVSANSLRLLDEDTKEEFDIPRRIVDTHFVYGYCSTCHSLQGSSIDGRYVIFEWNHRFSSRKWFYVAISRSTNLNSVHLFKDKPEEIDDKLIKQYFLNKIENYKKQDKIKKIEIPENYIDIDWLKNCIGKSCGSCGCQLELEVVNGKVESNITADRIYNTSPHSKDNIIPCCNLCNCSRGKRYWFPFMIIRIILIIKHIIIILKIFFIFFKKDSTP